jgi:hypothetical protein
LDKKVNQMARTFLIIIPLTLLFCTSCAGLIVHSSKQIELENDCNEKDVISYYCEKEPDKIKQYFPSAEKNRYIKGNREYWVLKSESMRGVLLGAILPIPLYIPWTNDTIFEFENGKRVHTSLMRNWHPGILCGLIIGIEKSEWTCLTGKEIYY